MCESSSLIPRRPTGRSIRIDGQYFWHRFFSHQPDLNYDNEALQVEMLDVMRFWMNLGLDGFRCDAVPYLLSGKAPFARTCRKRTSSCAALAR